MGHGSTCQCASADGKIGQLSLSRFTCLHVFFQRACAYHMPQCRSACACVGRSCAFHTPQFRLPARDSDDHAHDICIILHPFVFLHVIPTIVRMSKRDLSAISSECVQKLMKFDVWEGFRRVPPTSGKLSITSAGWQRYCTESSTPEVF